MEPEEEHTFDSNGDQLLLQIIKAIADRRKLSYRSNFGPNLLTITCGINEYISILKEARS